MSIGKVPGVFSVSFVVAVAALSISACSATTFGQSDRLDGLVNPDGQPESVVIDRPTAIGIVAANCPHAQQYLAYRVRSFRVLADQAGAQFLLVDVTAGDVALRARSKDMLAIASEGTRILFDRRGVLTRAFALYYQGGLPTTIFVAAGGTAVTRIPGVGDDADFRRDLVLAKSQH